MPKAPKNCILCGLNFYRLDRHLMQIHKLEAGSVEHKLALLGRRVNDLSPAANSEADGEPDSPPTVDELPETEDPTLISYKAYISGNRKDQRSFENSMNTLNHVKSFIKALGGHSIGLSALQHAHLVSEWVDSLRNKKLTPTTVKCYLLDSRAFVRYLLMCEPPGLVVTREQLHTLMHELGVAEKANRSALNRHKESVHEEKQAGVISADKLRVPGKISNGGPIGTSQPEKIKLSCIYPSLHDHNNSTSFSQRWCQSLCFD